MTIEKNPPKGMRVRARRLACGLTQRESADMLHISLTQFRYYEYDRSEMPVDRWEMFLLKSEKFYDIVSQLRAARKEVRQGVA